MLPPIRWFVIIGALIAAIFIYFWNESRKRINSRKIARLLEEKQLLEEENKYFQNVILTHIEAIEKSVQQFKNYLSAEKGYSRHNEVSTWKNECKELHAKIEGLRFTNIGLDGSHVDLINNFLQYFVNCESLGWNT